MRYLSGVRVRVDVAGIRFVDEVLKVSDPTRRLYAALPDGGPELVKVKATPLVVELSRERLADGERLASRLDDALNLLGSAAEKYDLAAVPVPTAAGDVLPEAQRALHAAAGARRDATLEAIEVLREVLR